MTSDRRLRTRARHLLPRTRARLGFLASATVAVLLGSVIAAVPTSPAHANFPRNEAIVYLAQGDGGNPVRTQLMRGLQSNGSIAFSDVGTAHTGPQYNAIGFNEDNGFLYGVRSPTAAGQSPKIVRIGPGGGVTVIKDATAASVSGAFGAVDNRFYYFTNTHMYYTNVANAAGPTTATALFGSGVGTTPADVTYAGGYFWGYLGGGTISRINPANGGMVNFSVAALNGHAAAGGAFTYGNGNLGFSKNTGGILQVRVANPGAAAPTFTLVSSIAGPGSSSNDGASSMGDPTDLAIEKTVSRTTAKHGDEVSYTLRVRNDGPGVSSGFTVTDSFSTHLDIGTLPTGCSRSGQDVTCSGGRLVVGGTTTFTIPATVRATAPRGALANTAAVLANELDEVAANNRSTASFRVVVPSLSLDKIGTVDGGGSPTAGGAITYSFVVTNTGDMPLTNVRITDPLVAGITPASASLAVGASTTFTATAMTITQAHIDSGSIDNTATATGTAEGVDVTSSDTVNIPAPSAPALTAVKSASPDDTNGNGVADEGETITYTIRVTNTGNVTLTGVSVDDPLLPLLTRTVTLAPGDFEDFSGDYVVTATDLTNGSVVNQATATGTPPTGPPITTPPTTTTTETTRTGITLVKSAIWDDADSDGQLEEGDVIRYQFVVTNTGNVPLENPSISDPFLVSRGITITWPGGGIAPGEQVVFTSNPLTVATGDIVDGEIVNTATATATPTGGSAITSNPSSVTTPLEPLTPGLALDKQSTLTDTNGNGVADVGETIAYRLVATNTGNVTLSTITASDAMFGPGELTPASFATLIPGQQGVFAATHTVTQADVDAGSIVNTATVSAPRPGGGADLTDTDTETVTTVPADPGITILKTASLGDANTNLVADEGEVITYSFTVTNTGNVTMTGVVIDDPMFAQIALGTIAPGASQTVSRTYTVLASDLANGSVDNTATATGTPPSGPPIPSDPSTTTTTTVSPGLEIVKEGVLADADGSGAAGIGETISYTFAVTNTGNTRLEGVRINDSRVATVSPASVTLEPTGVFTFTATYVVTEADILAGTIVNTATAEGDLPGGGSFESDPDTWTEATDPVEPGLEITKSARITDDDGNTIADLGEHIEYSFLVRNSGNATITGITVTDPKVTGLPGAFDLAPGESRTVTAALYEVVQADVDAGEVANSATATGTGPSGSVTSDPSATTVPVQPATPALTVVKSVEITGPLNANGVADEDEVLTYTFVVTNTGNVTIDNVSIDDPTVTGATSPDSGPLAPGATRTFTVDYTVLASDISAPNGDGALVNRATAEGETLAGDPVRSSEAATSIPVAAPGLSIVKTSTFADTDSNGMADVGEVVTYSFVVTNTGNVELADVEIVDARLAQNIVIGSIAAGASITRTATYIVTEADIIAQSLVNSATARGVIPGIPPTPVESPESVTSTPLAPDASELELVKTSTLEDTNRNGLADAGEQITYRFSVTNTGNRTLTDVEIVDPMLDGLLPAAIATLAPKETVVVESAAYTVTEADTADGEVRNIATASGVSPSGSISSVPSTATLSVNVPASTGLALTGMQLQTLIVVALGAFALGGFAYAFSRQPARTPRHALR